MGVYLSLLLAASKVVYSSKTFLRSQQTGMVLFLMMLIRF